ncbi:TPA: hypothetical protein HA278_03000 [Candidatus Woesearchaeota archaeon]|nr:hypothetical protein [Candidatus Woesearchaeota archaeon]
MVLDEMYVKVREEVMGMTDLLEEEYKRHLLSAEYYSVDMFNVKMNEIASQLKQNGFVKEAYIIHIYMLLHEYRKGEERL